MLYCYFVGDNIGEPQSLPTNYLNISNFNLLDESTINGYNFYKFIDSEKPGYNPLSQKIITQLFFENNSIVPVYTVENLSNEEVGAILSGLKSSLAASVENYLNSKVLERDYKSVIHACSYAESTVPQYKAEALSVVAWRDSVWIKAYSIQEEVLNGQRDVPSENELLAELPSLEWPQ